MTNSSSTEFINVKRFKEELALISKETLSYFTLINTWGIGQGVVTLGLVVNGLNIVVFVRQGLRDSVNLSLLGLSISDFGSLFVHFFANLCWTPSLKTLDLPFYPLQLMYVFVWIHVVFTRVTTGTTAWITFERCMCIVAPLKIKSIVTTRRTMTFFAGLYVIMLSSALPVFYTTRAVWVFDSRLNRSLLGITKITGGANIQRIAFLVNNILPAIFFIFITICTFILVRVLKQHATWKEQSVSSQKQNIISNRDTKVAKMVTIISIVFIACYAPGTVVYIVLLLYPQMTYTGKQENLVVVVFSMLMHLEAINASANFFIYLTVSSKFKRTFQNLFWLYCIQLKERLDKNAPEIAN